MKNEMKHVLEGMFSSIQDEQNNKAKEVLGEAYMRIIGDEKMKNPEHFNIVVAYDAQNVVDSLASLITENMGKGSDFYFSHYDFVENHISRLCTAREGSSCSTDKARHIIRLYLKYLETGAIPTIDIKKGDYWKPKFGNGEEWMEFCESLHHLYYGNSAKYFVSYKNLVSSPVKTFDYILHNWYLELNDGTTVQIGNTWDEDETNPHQHNFKDEYAILPKHLFPNHAFVCCEAEEYDIFQRVIVPNADIKRVYKVSETRNM